MAAPTYSPGTFGNVFLAAVAPGKTIAGLVDLTTKFRGAVTCGLVTGGTAPTAATAFSFRRVPGATAAGNTTLAAAPAVGATSLSVASATGIYPGQQVALIAAATGVGELATVSAVSGTTLTVTAIQNAYAVGDKVFACENGASGGTYSPTNYSGSWSANSVYSSTVTPPAGSLWVAVANNGDASATVTAFATLDLNPTFA